MDSTSQANPSRGNCFPKIDRHSGPCNRWSSTITLSTRGSTMAKFLIKETYTPDDHALERGRDQSEFYTDSDQPTQIMKAGLAALGHEEFASEFEDEIVDQLQGLCFLDDWNENTWEVTLCANDGEYHLAVEQLQPRIETPINRETLIAWARERVAKHPTREEEQWDEQKKEWLTATVQNTPQFELASIAGRFQDRMLEDYKASDLRERLHDLYWNGMTGYKQMSLEEIAEEITSEVLDFYDFCTLEDLLSEFG